MGPKNGLLQPSAFIKGEGSRKLTRTNTGFNSNNSNNHGIMEVYCGRKQTTLSSNNKVLSANRSPLGDPIYVTYAPPDGEQAPDQGPNQKKDYNMQHNLKFLKKHK